jgi:hypothetical protein
MAGMRRFQAIIAALIGLFCLASGVMGVIYKHLDFRIWIAGAILACIGVTCLRVSASLLSNTGDSGDTGGGD